MGAPPNSLSWLLSWKAQGAQGYARTGLIKTVALQREAARIIRDHLGKTDPVGEALNIENLRVHLERRKVPTTEVKRLTTAMNCYPDGPSVKCAWLTTEIEEQAASSSGQSLPQRVAPELGATSAEHHPTSGYVVAISQKKGLRRLHHIGACRRRPGHHYINYEGYGDSCPAAELYDAYCKRCWGSGVPPAGDQAESDGAPSSVSTESESSSSAA